MPRPRDVRLVRALERRISEGHPWIYRDALARFQAEPGEELRILTRNGNFLARGYADVGPIGVRIVTRRDEPIGRTLLIGRIERAAELRDQVVPRDTDAYRLLHGEGDELPGVVVDVYAEFAVARFDGAGAEALRERVVDALWPRLEKRGVRGLMVKTGRRGSTRVEVARGDAPPDEVVVREYGMKLLVDLHRGQKTGLFLDHREGRHRVRSWAADRRVLNLYSYTGGFSISAGLGGAAAVTSVDVAKGAIGFADRGFALNDLPAERHRGVVADVGEFLTQGSRQARNEKRWDLVIADPPSFAPNKKSVETALATYEKLHESALRRVASGGLYLGASCSSHIDHEAFFGTIRNAARKARVRLQLLDRWGAPPDHPRLLAFPEGDYLKSVLCRVLS